MDDDDGGLQFWQQYQQWEEEENERLSGNQCGSKALRSKNRKTGRRNKGTFKFPEFDVMHCSAAGGEWSLHLAAHAVA